MDLTALGQLAQPALLGLAGVWVAMVGFALALWWLVAKS
jgi:hypothetical protein